MPPARTMPVRSAGVSQPTPPWSRVEGTLMAAARSVRRAYDMAFAEIDINLSEASVLAHLADGGALSQAELARRVGTGRARVGVHIDSLEAKGAVRRDADPDDRRVWLVSLEPLGLDLWQRSVEADRALRKELRARTTQDERAVLDAALSRIRANADALLERADR